MTKVALSKTSWLPEQQTFLRRQFGIIVAFPTSPRCYTFRCNLPDFQAKLFKEHDVPFLVDSRLYDIGFCGTDILKEYEGRHERGALTVLGIVLQSIRSIYLLPSVRATSSSHSQPIRIVSDYPALAEQFAKRQWNSVTVVPVSGRCLSFQGSDIDYIITAVTHEDAVTIANSRGRLLFEADGCIIGRAEHLRPDNAE